MIEGLTVTTGDPRLQGKPSPPSVNERIIKAYAFCPKDQYARLPKMPKKLRDAIIEEIRGADLPPRKFVDFESMHAVAICWALLTTWSLLFVQKALGRKALGSTRIRPTRR